MVITNVVTTNVVITNVVITLVRHRWVAVKQRDGRDIAIAQAKLADSIFKQRDGRVSDDTER